jgi:probable rRNA maturation factor
MSDIVNLQRKVKLDLAAISAFVAELPNNVAEANAATFTVAFISDDRMKQLNSTFHGKDTTTDVLSFPHAPDEFSTLNSQLSTFLGDIVISAEQAQKQAAENKLTIECEIKQLILHGLLHLSGYDHETDNGEMNKLELGLRRKLRI